MPPVSARPRRLSLAVEGARLGCIMAKLEWTREELLSDLPYDEPLFAGGVRCHGGFAGGKYVSPRTLHRAPAIEAWQARLRAEGHLLVDVPHEFVPPHYPNYPQAKLLLQEGVREPVVRALTIDLDRRGLRGADPRSAAARPVARGGRRSLRHRPRPPRQRPVRSARARRGRLSRGRRPQADVGGGARSRACQARDPRRRAARDDEGGGRGERRRMFPELSSPPRGHDRASWPT